MALYDFVCNDCGHCYEIYVQGFLKDEERKCPKCGSTDVRQKYTSFLGNVSSGAENRCAPSGGSGFG